MTTKKIEYLEELQLYCKKLKLSRGLTERAMEKGTCSNLKFLSNLLKAEVDYRAEARVVKLLNGAAFPIQYSPSMFDPSEITFPDGTSFESLLDLDFYKDRENIIMYGGSGTGKTMLSILIGLAAVQAGISVKFFRTSSLVVQLSECSEKSELGPFLARLTRADIIVLDEFGYTPFNVTGAQLLFDFISSINDKSVIILNTNLEFSEWVKVLYDEKMTTALIGRLVQNSRVLLFYGRNRRISEKIPKLKGTQNGSVLGRKGTNEV